MRYLGRISGSGTLQHDGDFIARATFDIDGFLVKNVRLNCGEIKAPAGILNSLFGREDIQIITDDGRVLALTFADSILHEEADVAQMDIKSVLPQGRGRMSVFDMNDHDHSGVLS